MALILSTNSYTTADDADVYFETRLGTSAWDVASEDDKDSALVTASLEIDDNSFIGYVTDTNQALAWPRSEASFYNKRTGLNETFDEDEVPTQVVNAVFEQALHILSNTDAVASAPSVNYESISVGSISLSDSNGTNGSTTVSKVSKFSRKLISPLLVTSGGGSWWRSN